MGTFSRDNRTLLYNGSPAKLAGALAGKDDYTTTDQLVPPFNDDMPRLSDFNNNFTRHWLIPYWKYSPKNSINPVNCAFARQGNKWNLSAYNADYFARLNQMIDAAAQAHIAVQLVLFDRCGLDVSKADEAPVQRWPDSPWNASNNVNGMLANDPAPGIPRFYTDQAMRPLQEAWIRYAVGQTKNHWNVFYEVMNEPVSNAVDDRVGWANWVVGVIHSVTGGANLIFYNSFPGISGQDVATWQAGRNAQYRNYDKFHGVIFHGDPTTVDPTHGGYPFLNEKIFQVCSDGGPAAVRDRFDTNKNWTSWAFAHNMMFQAHSLSTEAARGVGWNSPTPLR